MTGSQFFCMGASAPESMADDSANSGLLRDSQQTNWMRAVGMFSHEYYMNAQANGETGMLLVGSHNHDDYSRFVFIPYEDNPTPPYVEILPDGRVGRETRPGSAPWLVLECDRITCAAAVLVSPQKLTALAERTPLDPQAFAEEALRRYSGDTDVETGESFNDWGYAESERRAFVAGAIWAANHEGGRA